jgi:hypothetical protein
VKYFSSYFSFNFYHTNTTIFIVKKEDIFALVKISQFAFLLISPSINFPPPYRRQDIDTTATRNTISDIQESKPISGVKDGPKPYPPICPDAITEIRSLAQISGPLI